MKRLQQLGDSAGNKTLRENLGWQEEKYFRVRKNLVEEGLVEIGRGKGGSVYLLEDPLDEVSEPTNKFQTLKFEKDHYPLVVEKLEKQLKQDFQDAVVEQTAHKGSAPGGKWSRPDVLALTVQRFEYVVQDEFILRSYEIERSDVVDTDAVAEAAAHQRMAQLSYLVIVPHGDSKSIFDSTNVKRRAIERECLKSGVGLILIPDYNLSSEIELAVDAGITRIDYRDVNSTIGRFFSEQKRLEIKELINLSRLGELRKLLHQKA
ncbi:hypothetical protein [Rhodopila sp.]|uniref:hypothetical protein n=1 Tax=Rhodopila sp. TaxID=2480087 RepID=UPI003D100539